MKISNTEICTFCNAIDVIEHFFVECKHIEFLWRAIEVIASARMGKMLHLATHEKLLGYKTQNAIKYKWLNQVIIIAKLCISKYKYGSQYHPDLCV
jgi:hypothetical protein